MKYKCIYYSNIKCDNIDYLLNFRGIIILKILFWNEFLVFLVFIIFKKCKVKMFCIDIDK